MNVVGNLIYVNFMLLHHKFPPNGIFDISLHKHVLQVACRFNITGANEISTVWI